MASISDDGARFAQTSASLTTSFALTDSLGMYVEYFGMYPNARNADCAHYINGGFIFPVTEDLQFDIRAGAGLNDEADDFFVGAGFAIRR